MAIHSSQFSSKEELPLLPIRDIVIYPFMILPLFVGRDSSVKAVEEALNHHDRHILLASQKDVSAESPAEADIYKVGTIAMVMRMRKLPDGRIKILIQGLAKASIQSFTHSQPFYKAKFKMHSNTAQNQATAKTEALTRAIKAQLEQIIKQGKGLSADILMILEDIQEPGRLADLIASNLNLKVTQAQDILETTEPAVRLEKIHKILQRELEVLSHRPQTADHKKESSKNIFSDPFALKQGFNPEEEENEFEEIRKKIIRSELPASAEKESLKQLTRLEKMHPDSSEANILRSYLEWMYELPWSITSEDSLDIAKAQQVLNQDHFNLQTVKQRVLEYLSVKQLKNGVMKGPILCLAGPPGVGKTSLGKSIARAIGREFVRISLGGVKDEAEIRGHRRTYVGAMPGRFIQALKQAGTNNPVILLDEIDKLGSDFRGDPSSALLEVLDPEQNHTFRDHYLNTSFDLSNVIFIATANNLQNIPSALMDRMELLELSGYTQEEKLAISQKYLVPKQMEENGINSEDASFATNALQSVISHYTREAGLRNLERRIGTLCRKVAYKKATGVNQKIDLTPQIVEDFLGPHIFSSDPMKEKDEIGIATGLAWTEAGGDVLFIESTKMKGKGLTLTGQLGDVMKESAQTAVGYIRSQAERLGIDSSFFESHEIHLHLPAGAIPKDGPSAGITLATAIISLLTQTPIAKDVAMTGEITLTGKVLPVGGIKEKVLAAMRMGISNIIIPWKNRKDLLEIPPELRKKMVFIPVKTIEEVLPIALVNWKNRANSLESQLTPLAA